MAQTTVTSQTAHPTTLSTPPIAQAKSRKQLPQQLPPGPPWPTALWNAFRFSRQPLSFLEELRQRYGEVVTLPMAFGSWTLVFHPDGVRHVVQENHFNYRKGGIAYRMLRLTLGNGLLTNNGDSWLQQRRLIQPIFHRRRIADFGRVMTESATSWADEVSRDTNEPLDVYQRLSGLTLSIVCKALFGADMFAYKQRIFAAISTINRLEAQAVYVPGLLTLPTPQRRRLSAARATLDAIVDALIAGRRDRATGSKNDLLTMLLEAQDAETGERMSDQQLRDEVMTLMVAGHETTTNALSWTLLLLAQHPDIEAQVMEEYTQVLGGRAAQMEESMRLFPPAWTFARSAIDEDEIGGYRIAKGTYIALFPAVTHRHPDFWEQPDVFDPERFDSERSSGRHRFAYFPFGGGPRGCIGNQFAFTEAQLVLATILPRYQFRLPAGVHVVPEPQITLRPRGGLVMTIARRGEQS